MSNINLLVYESLQNAEVKTRKLSDHPYHQIFRKTLELHGAKSLKDFSSPAHRSRFFQNVKENYAKHKMSLAK